MKGEYKSNIWKMNLIRFVGSFAFFVAVTIPFFIEWGGLNFTQILLLQSWFMLCKFALEVPTGVIADKYGRKTSLILSGVAGVLAPLVYASIPNFFIFLIGEFLFALSGALSSGADKALIYDSLKKEKILAYSKTAFGNYSISNFFSIILSAPIGSYIAGVYNVRSTVLLTAVPVLISTIISFSLKEPKTNKKLDEEKFIKLAFNGLKYLKKKKELLTLALNAAILSTLSYYIMWVYQPLLGNAGLNIKYYGYVAAGMNILAIILIKNTKTFKKFFGKKGTLLLIGLSPLICFILLTLTRNIVLVITLILFAMGTRLARQPLMDHYYNKHIPSKQRATVLSSISMLESSLLVLSNLFVGMLIDWSLNNALIILGILGIIASLVFRIQEEQLSPKKALQS